MTTSSVASLSFFCLLVLLLPAQHGASHARYKLGSRQIFPKTPGKSSGNSQQASTGPTATSFSSSIATGLGNNKLPVHGLMSLTAADVLRRDASRIRHHFSSQSSLVAASTTSPAVAIIHTNGSSHPMRLPGVLHYSVLVSYGTPEQQFQVFLDTSSIGASLVRCKPCASGSADCDPAFDPSRSSTFTHVLCGTPDCPTSNCSSDSFCPLDGIYSIIEGAFVEDVLTLGSSTAIQRFRFVCLDVDLLVAGTLDLSRHRNSLPSQLSSSGQVPAATFSYCLPKSPKSQGYLSLGVDATVRDKHITVHAPLVSNGKPELASMYFIDLVGINLGGEDIPIPAETFGNNSTILDVGTTFTMLTPDAYMPLRDTFRKQMSQNNCSLQGFDGFDTCYNLTTVRDLTIPVLRFKFSNGERLQIDFQQMMYYDNPAAAPFTMACLAFSSLDASDALSAVIGTYNLASMEVVYDVAGGKVGFNPWSC